MTAAYRAMQVVGRIAALGADMPAIPRLGRRGGGERGVIGPIALGHRPGTESGRQSSAS